MGKFDREAFAKPKLGANLLFHLSHFVTFVFFMGLFLRKAENFILLPFISFRVIFQVIYTASLPVLEISVDFYPEFLAREASNIDFFALLPLLLPYFDRVLDRS